MSIVAHSLGAIICFDIMANQTASSTNSAAAACPTDKRVRVSGVIWCGGEIWDVFM